MNAHTSIRMHAPRATDLRSVSHGGSHCVECTINGTAFVWFFDTEAAADRCRFGLEIAFGFHNTAKDSAADEYPEYTRECNVADTRYQAMREQEMA